MSIRCYSEQHRDVRALAILAVLVYPVGLFLFTALLLLQARPAIQSEVSTIQSEATQFLHREYKKHFFAWELVLTLTPTLPPTRGTLLHARTRRTAAVSQR